MHLLKSLLHWKGLNQDLVNSKSFQYNKISYFIFNASCDKVEREREERERATCMNE